MHAGDNSILKTIESSGRTINEITEQLPLGIYFVKENGDFLFANNYCRSLFNISNNELLNTNIGDYYYHSDDRKKYTDLLLKDLSEDYFHIQILPLKINGNNKFYKDIAKPIFDTEDNLLGFFGYIIDVTDEYRQRLLVENLPAGIYCLNESNEIKKVNQAMLDILGYSTEDQLLGKKISDLYVDMKEYNHFDESIKKEGSVKNAIIRLIKANGEILFAVTNSFGLFDPNDNYLGREGTIIDVSSNERYIELLHHIPLGYYHIRIEDDVNKVIDCNSHFIELFELGTKEDAKDLDVARLFQDKKELTNLNKMLNDQKGLPLLGHHIRAKSIENSQLSVEVNIQPISDIHGAIKERIGIIRDISDEVALHVLRQDIGQLLHTYSSTLNMIKLSLKPIIFTFRPDPFKLDEQLNIHDIEEQLDKIIGRVIREIEELVSNITHKYRGPVPAFKGYSEMLRFKKVLKNYKQQFIYPELFYANIRHLTQQLLRSLPSAEKSNIYNLPEVILECRNLERISNLIAIHNISDAITEIEYPINAMREYISLGIKSMEEEIVVDIQDLLSQSRLNLAEYATFKKVTIDEDVYSGINTIKCVKRDMIRVFMNILHNAIKYSWDRKNGKRWVQIKIKQIEDKLVLEFENYGVPIPKDEIINGSIYELGFRGRESGDRGRPGTGVGLADVKRTLEKFKGKIKIESIPTDTITRYGDVPYITTVKVSLPIWSN